MHQHIVVVQHRSSIHGSFQDTVVLIIIMCQFAVRKLIESGSARSKHVVRLVDIRFYTVDILILVTRRIPDVILIDGPVILVQYLDGTGTGIKRESRKKGAAAGIELVVDKLHIPEMIILRTSRLQAAYQLHQFALVLFLGSSVSPHFAPSVSVEQVVREGSAIGTFLLAVGIDLVIPDFAPVHLESQWISIADFPIRHIELDDTQSIAQIGEFAIHIDIVDGLVARDGGRIVIRQILHAPVLGVHQVDVGIAVEDEQPLGSLVVSDVLDIAVVQKVHLAEGLNALVVSVVSIEIAGSLHEYPVAGFFYFLHFAVRHIGFPVADGGAALESGNLKNQEREEYPYFLSHLSKCI